MLWNSLGSTSVVINKNDLSEHNVVTLILVANEVIATTVKEIGKQFREVSEDELDDTEHKTYCRHSMLRKLRETFTTGFPVLSISWRVRNAGQLGGLLVLIV
jgi:hypothetical protein